MFGFISCLLIVGYFYLIFRDPGPTKEIDYSIEDD